MLRRLFAGACGHQGVLICTAFPCLARRLSTVAASSSRRTVADAPETALPPPSADAAGAFFSAPNSSRSPIERNLVKHFEQFISASGEGSDIGTVAAAAEALGKQLEFAERASISAPSPLAVPRALLRSVARRLVVRDTNTLKCVDVALLLRLSRIARGRMELLFNSSSARSRSRRADGGDSSFAAAVALCMELSWMLYTVEHNVARSHADGLRLLEATLLCFGLHVGRIFSRCADDAVALAGDQRGGAAARLCAVEQAERGVLQCFGTLLSAPALLSRFLVCISRSYFPSLDETAAWPRIVRAIEGTAKAAAIRIKHDAADAHLLSDLLLFNACLLRNKIPWKGLPLFSRFVVCLFLQAPRSGAAGGDKLLPFGDVKTVSRLAFVIGAAKLATAALLREITAAFRELRGAEQLQQSSAAEGKSRELASIERSLKIMHHQLRNRGPQHRTIVFAHVSARELLAWSDHGLLALAQDGGAADSQQPRGVDEQRAFGAVPLDRVVTTKQIDLSRPAIDSEWGLRVSSEGRVSVPSRCAAGNPFHEQVLRPTADAGCWVRIVAVDGTPVTNVRAVKSALADVVRVRLTVCVVRNG